MLDANATQVHRADARALCIGDAHPSHGASERIDTINELRRDQISAYDLIAVRLSGLASWSEGTLWLETIGRALAPGGVVECEIDDAVAKSSLACRLTEAFDILDTTQRSTATVQRLRRRSTDIAITVDYEMYEPPEAQRLPATLAVVERQMLIPTSRMLDACESHGAKLTIYAEVCQLWLLKQGFPHLAAAIEDQLIDAVRRGHDVQLHAHIRWYDATGASVDTKRSAIVRGPTDRIHGLSDGAMRAFFRRGKDYLEALLRPTQPAYRCVAFRAGKYQIEPHTRVMDALRREGFLADSSVWLGGYLPWYDNEPGFDYRTQWHPFWPYRPAEDTINAPAMPDPGAIVELPILSSRTGSWTFDTAFPEPQIALYEHVRGFGGPRVMIGHSKLYNAASDATLRAILQRVAADPHAKFVTTATMAEASYRDTAYAAEQVSYAAARSIELATRLVPSTAARAVVQALNAISVPTGSIVELAAGTGEVISLPLARLQSRPVLASGIEPRAATTLAAIARHESLALQAIEADPTPNRASVAVLNAPDRQVDLFEIVGRAAQSIVPGGLVLIVTINPYGKGLLARRALERGGAVLMRLPEWLQRPIIGRYAQMRSRQIAQRTVAHPLDVVRLPVESGTLLQRPARGVSRHALVDVASRHGLVIEHWSVLGQTAAASRLDRMLGSSWLLALRKPVATIR